MHATLAARWLLMLLLAITLGYLAGCSTTGDSQYKTVHKTSSDSTFPIPDGIADNVEFWRKIYGEMDRNQVAIHDNNYMDVIYEVVEVPPAYRGSNESRRAFIRGKQEEYRVQLASLERKVASGESLTAADRDLLSRLEAVGGKTAVFGASDRVRTQQGMRERFRSGMEISGRYDKAFREIFRKHGVPEDLAFLPHVESSFRSTARSGVGAAGLWQFMPATGRIYDLKVDHKLDERMDPLLACEGAARYLASAHHKLGSWPLAITSYNHGQGGMAKAKDLYGDDIGKIVKNYKGEAFGFDSRNFYSQFVAAREVAGNPNKYFPDGIDFHNAHDYDRLVLKYPMPAQHLASHYGLTVYQLDDLNPSWGKAVVRGDASIPAGSTVWLPAGTTQRITTDPEPPAVMIAKAEPASEYLSVRTVVKPRDPVLSAKGKADDGKDEVRPAQALAKTDAKANDRSSSRDTRSLDSRVTDKQQANLAKTDTKAAAKSGTAKSSAGDQPQGQVLASASAKGGSKDKASASGKSSAKQPETLAKADSKTNGKAAGAMDKMPANSAKQPETLAKADGKTSGKAGGAKDKVAANAAKQPEASAKADSKSSGKAGGAMDKTTGKSPALAKVDVKGATQTASGNKAKGGATPDTQKLAKGDDSKASGKTSPPKQKAEAKNESAKDDSAKPTKAGKAKLAAKIHTVQPNETLQRVAALYDMSIDEIKRLNNMGSGDNTIKTGQRLKVNS